MLIHVFIILKLPPTPSTYPLNLPVCSLCGCSATLHQFSTCSTYLCVFHSMAHNLFYQRQWITYVKGNRQLSLRYQISIDANKQNINKDTMRTSSLINSSHHTQRQDTAPTALQSQYRLCQYAICCMVNRRALSPFYFYDHGPQGQPYDETYHSIQATASNKWDTSLSAVCTFCSIAAQ